jgi:hypothetical protein
MESYIFGFILRLYLLLLLVTISFFSLDKRIDIDFKLLFALNHYHEYDCPVPCGDCFCCQE